MELEQELEGKPDLGKIIVCPHCGEEHDVKYGNIKKDGVWVTDTKLAFYTCGKKTCLAGIDGKSLIDEFKKEE